jgi:glucosamine--fructose-6-phosphate aminotransferase (isomerizing)
LEDIDSVIVTGCGTAFYAGMVGRYMLENYANLRAEAILASEFRYQNPILSKNTALLCVSQSGETADTLAALRLAKKKGNLTLGIVNAVGSSLARETEAGIYNHIGPEIGVASTKAFTSQLVVLAIFTLFMARNRDTLSRQEAEQIIVSLYRIPSQITRILKQEEAIQRLTRKYSGYGNFLFLGRHFNYPTALEGALKLKEVSYTHAEGYAAGEMKHGPLALIDKDFPTIAIAGNGTSRTFEKIISNLEEIKARRGPILAVVPRTCQGRALEKLADDVIYVPETIEMLSPILNIVPLQLFAYHMAVLKNLDPDKPRNLAKSVTVE